MKLYIIIIVVLTREDSHQEHHDMKNGHDDRDELKVRKSSLKTTASVPGDGYHADEKKLRRYKSNNHVANVMKQ